MSKFPFQKQMDAMDCGPSCLNMIARHYGRLLPMDELREQSSLTRSGVTLGGIADAAENHDLKTVAIKASLETLEEEVTLPCIAHWRQKHFVVVYAIKKNHVYVADPAFGLVKYSKQEFITGWMNQINPGSSEEGILLLLDTTPEFYLAEDGDEKRSIGLGLFMAIFSPLLSFIFSVVSGLIGRQYDHAVFPPL